MRSLRAVEQDGALDLGARADDAAVADPYAAADGAAGTQLAVASDAYRPFDHRAREDACAPPDRDAVSQEMHVRWEPDFERLRRQGVEDRVERIAEQAPGRGRVEGLGELGGERGEKLGEGCGVGGHGRVSSLSAPRARGEGSLGSGDLGYRASR